MRTDEDRKTKNIVVRCLRPYKRYSVLRQREKTGQGLTWPRAGQSQCAAGRCRRRQVVLPAGEANAAQKSASGVGPRSGNTSENH